MALVTTVTELNAIAAAAMSGESRSPMNGYKHAHGYRDAERVVAEGADQILAHVAHRRSADLDRRHNAHQAALDQRDVACLDGDVGAGADGESDIGLRQRRCIVDAVADHADGLAFELQLLHLVRLVVGQHFGKHAIDADLARDGAARALVVAGQHDDFDAEALQHRNGRFRVGLHGVGDRHEPGGLAVDRDIHRRLAFVGETLPLCLQRFDRDAAIAHELGVAEQHVVAVDPPAHAKPGDRRKALGINQRQAFVPRRP